ncbi:MAG: hypothetical protein US43_C0017G0001, partial [Candidatus Levybacteria bacterium GW2011_GWA1_37_16]
MNKIQDFKFKFEILKKDKKSKARV